VRGRVAQQALRLADVGLAVAHVAGAEIAVHGLHGGFHAVGGQVVAQQGEQGVECGAVADGHVVDLVARLGASAGGGQQVGLHGVGYEAEVAAGFAVAVDVDRIALEQRGRPLGHHGGIGAVGILPRAEDVEVAQADGGEAVAASKYVGIEFVDVFGDGVGAERLADGVFDLGQAGVIAIGAAAGGVGEALDAGVARGDQHVQEAGDVGGVGGDGVFEAARHAAERGLVQHVVHALAGALAVGQSADVALDEAEARPLRGRDEALYFIQVALMASGEVVQPHHFLVEFEQGFEQVTADETGDAGDQPLFGCFCQLTAQGCVGGVHGGYSRRSDSAAGKRYFRS